MDEFGLEKTNKKLSENEVLIKVLTKLLKKKDAPIAEITAVIEWLNQRQKTLNRRYRKILDDIYEEAELLSNVYRIEEGDCFDEDR